MISLVQKIEYRYVLAREEKLREKKRRLMFQKVIDHAGSVVKLTCSKIVLILMETKNFKQRQADHFHMRVI